MADPGWPTSPVTRLYERLPDYLHRPLFRLHQNGLRLQRALGAVARHGTADIFHDVAIEINCDCNRSCSFCPNVHDRRSRVVGREAMAEPLLRSVVAQLAELRYAGRITPSFYGEPLLDARLERLLGLIKAGLPHSRIIILTNGDLLTVERYRSLVAAGAGGFKVNQYDQRPSDALVELREYLDKNPRERVPFRYKVFTAGTPLFNRGGLVRPARVNYFPECRMADNPLVIDAAGKVLLCCNDYFGAHVMGDLAAQRLRDIWSGEKYQEIRRQLRRREYRFEICRKCTGRDA